MTRGEGPADAVCGPGENAGSSAMAAYNEALAAGQFRIQRCSTCRQHVFYPRVICPHCASTELAWIEPSGLGTVYSTTVVRRPADKGGPYNVALIDLDEGVRLMSRVDGVAPQAVQIGMRVRVQVAMLNGAPAPVFHPIDAGVAA